LEAGGTTALDERLEPRGRGQGVHGFFLHQKAGSHQRVVQLVGVARIGPDFLFHQRNRIRVQDPQAAVRRRISGAPRHDGLRPPLLEGRVVDELVRPRVEDLV
jgi:hypothetical protein